MPKTPSQIGALLAARQRRWRVLGVGCVLLLFAGAWSFWPLPEAREAKAATTTKPASTAPKLPSTSAPSQRLDPRLFSAALWREPPVPELMGPPVPPPPALRLQLLGMRITTDEPLSAVIYDAELDTIEVVRHLDTYRGFRVVKLDRAGLELEGGGQRIGLRMDTDGAPGRGGAP